MPFTSEQFFNVFREYNIFVYPAQIIFLFAGLAAALLLNKKNKFLEYYVKIFIIILWLWIGLIYHLMFFTVINKAAYIFGALFIIQGILFFVEFFIRKKFVLSFESKFAVFTGYALLFFALVVYPLIGLLLGKSISYTILLGLPCPTVIFTFGVLLFTRKIISRYLLIVPVLWSIIGFFAALNFGVYQDTALPMSALVLLFHKKLFL